MTARPGLTYLLPYAIVNTCKFFISLFLRKCKFEGTEGISRLTLVN